ncbi:MAG TPA: aminotransferase class I/II-fold pyridoxal phosphate-dependent enzyme [Terriglobales bacterium]|nr:aminotransferase class I/II-fold pyridoxal phosphate-dependent enzyme [Terriglobales bacterium]
MAAKFSRRNLLTGMGAAAAAAVSTPALALPNRWFEPADSSAKTAATTTPEGVILLSRNENAYGPFASVQDAMRQALGRANRYTFPPDYAALIDGVSKLHSVQKNQIVVGAGSTEVLRMAAEAFTGPDKRLVTGHPTFEAMGEYASRRGSEVVRVPLTSSYAHDLDAMLRAAQGGQGGLIYICNPNNPTGSITPASELAEFIKQVPSGYVLLIDEAYHHFAEGQQGYAPNAPSDNVMIARTFSKVYGIAGIRLGYAVATPERARQIQKWQLDNNVNAVASRCGSVAMEDTAATREAARRIVSDREAFVREAKARSLDVIPTYTNFAMMESGHQARQVIEYFGRNKIQIGRPFPPMDTRVRISFGTPQEMKKFWQVWDQMKIAAVDFPRAGTLAATEYRWDGSC